MADLPISQFPVETTVSDDALIPVVETPSTTPANKVATKANLLKEVRSNNRLFALMGC